MHRSRGYPPARSNAWRWSGLFCCARPSCFWTNRLAHWMRSRSSGSRRYFGDEWRPEHRFRDQSNLVIGFVSVGFATFVTAILALTTAIRPQPWFDPHYAIPLAGIILGNVLNSASLSLDSFLGSVRRERQAIESRLSRGENYPEAIAPLVRQAIPRGLFPIIN